MIVQFASPADFWTAFESANPAWAAMYGTQQNAHVRARQRHIDRIEQPARDARADAAMAECVREMNQRWRVSCAGSREH